MMTTLCLLPESPGADGACGYGSDLLGRLLTGAVLARLEGSRSPAVGSGRIVMMRNLSIRQTLAPVLGRDADTPKELHMLSDAPVVRLLLQGNLNCLSPEDYTQAYFSFLTELAVRRQPSFRYPL